MDKSAALVESWFSLMLIFCWQVGGAQEGRDQLKSGNSTSVANKMELELDATVNAQNTVAIRCSR